ncbi:flagellar biosynthesis protein FlgA [Micromonospora sp. NPDC092111]|uniref:flagellar biosynthesis protein FlgA n=1 Tax=Micromonospora sp. NPDC092111 TaxID=3364289 RepID=UPI003827FEFC
MAVGEPDDGGSLRPVRWPRRPGGGTLLRAALVAALLGLAVVVLETPAGCPTPTPPPAGPASGSPGPAGRPAAGKTDPAGVLPAGEAGPAARSDAGAADPAGRPGAADAGQAARPDGEDSGRSAAGGGPPALPLPSGSVGVPVRLAEPAALAVLRPGARVDLLVVPAGRTATEAVLLAPGALVLDVVGGDGVDGSAALYLALRPDQAHRTVGQPEGSRFSVVVRG